MYYELEKSLLTGLEAIDNEHRELFIRVNKLLDAYNHGNSAAEFKALLRFLDFHLTSHVKLEESLMDTNNYPDTAIHKQEHEKFFHIIEVLNSTFKQSGASVQFINFLKSGVAEALIAHTLNHDKKLADFLLAQNKQNRF